MTAMGQAFVSFIFQFKMTFEFTLLIFWPPAPELLEKEKVNSEKGILILSIVVIILT